MQLAFFVSLGIFLLGLILFLIIRKDKGIFPHGTITSLVGDEKILRIDIPQHNEKYITSAYNFLVALHGLGKGFGVVPIIALELRAKSTGGVEFYIKAPKQTIAYIKSQVYAQYPVANITEVKDYVFEFKDVPEGVYVNAAALKLSREFVFPIKTMQDFDVDPLASIAASIDNLLQGEEVYIQYVIRPYPDIWQAYSQSYIKAVKEGKDPSHIFKKKTGFWAGVLKALAVIASILPSTPVEVEAPKLEKHIEEELNAINQKAQNPGFQVAIRIITKATMPERNIQLLEGIVAAYQQFSMPRLNGLVVDEALSSNHVLAEFLQRYLSEDEEQNILSVPEVATLYHLPYIDESTRFLYRVTATKLPPPANLPVKQGLILGITDYRGRYDPFGILDADKPLHMYVLGKSGTGKSTLLKNMVIGDILRGKGVALIDPHGDLAEDVLNYIPQNRIEDTIYFNPADAEWPIGFNPIQLKEHDKSQRDLIADAIVGVFKKIFASWGPRLEYLLYNSIITVLESQGTTLLSIQRMLVDKEYRKRVLSHVKDPAILNFWRTEFAAMEQNKKLLTEAIAPIQNKIGRFLSPRLIRNILGQVRSTINIPEIMNEGKIFIVNLAKGKVGEESAMLLGGLLITRIYSASLERASMSPDQRKLFSLYIDEVQSFTTDAFSNILSEARKYNLALVMAHQFLEQLPQNIVDSIFGNVGSMIVFNVGQEDAFRMSREFAPFLKPEDFLLLRRFEIYVKLAIEGQSSKPFSARTLPLIYEPYNLKNDIIVYTRNRYCIPRQEIEEKLNKWLSK